MGLTRFPHGIFATPTIGGSGAEYAGWFSSNVWYVDGDNGSDGNAGNDMSLPVKTIQRAINLSGPRDTIYIKSMNPTSDASEPGQYIENLTIPYANYGLKLIGVSATGELQPFDGPKVKNASAAPLLTVNAPYVLIKGISWNCTRNSGTYGIKLMGDVANYGTQAGSVGTQIVDCYFKNSSTTYGAIYIYGGYECLVSRCTFQLGDIGVWIDSNTTPGNGHCIEYCNFKANNGSAVAKHIYVYGSCDDILINQCTFGIATKFLIVSGAATGLVSNCTFADTVATLANSTGKVQVPATQAVKVTGCWGGVSLAVIQSAA